jgi:hypothetical protein
MLQHRVFVIPSQLATKAQGCRADLSEVKRLLGQREMPLNVLENEIKS